MLKLLLPVSVAVIAIGATTYFQGTWSERWMADELAAELEVATAKLDDLPMFVGDWRGVNTKDIDEDQIERAGVTGHRSMVFKNVRTDEQISYFFVSGKPRHVAIHTPDDCYVAAGFAMLEPPQRITIPTETGEATFYTTQFRRESGDKQQLRIFWAWNQNGTWEAPEYPRWSYAYGPALFKLYAIVPVQPGLNPPIDENHPCYRFLQAMVPELDRTLFEEEEQSEGRVTEQHAGQHANEAERVASEPARG